MHCGSSIFRSRQMTVAMRGICATIKVPLGAFSVPVAPDSSLHGPSSASLPFINNVGDYRNTPARIAGEDVRKGRGDWGHAVTRFPGSKFVAALRPRGVAKYALELAIIGAGYFLLAKIGLTLASIYSSAVPIWPPAGLALAAVLLGGLRIWPAIFVAAFAAGVPPDIADATAADSFWLSLSVAAGSTLEAVIGGYLINVGSQGRSTFDTPDGVAKFALVGLGASMIGAIVGSGSLYLAEYVDWANFIAIGATWWLRDAAGALVITPVVVLWAIGDFRPFNADKVLASGATIVAASVVGLIAFSPLIEPSVNGSALGFLAVLPLLWAALRCGKRDTATAVLILSCFAVWGTLAGGGPFAGATLVGFMISISVGSLALSAYVAVRKRVEAKLRQQEQILRAMFSQSVVGIAQIDTAGRFNLVNNGFCAIVRRPAPELLQMRIQELAEPDDLPYIRNLIGHAVHTGEGFVIETRDVLPDGSRLRVRNNVSAITDHSGAVRHLMVVAEDVTERRRAEEDLQRAHDDLQKTVDERTATLEQATEVLQSEIEQRKRVEAALKHDIAERRKAQEALMESEWRFRTVIQGVTDYAIFMLDRSGYITNWNVGAQRIHQYSAAEIVGQHFSRFYTEEEQQRGEPARALQVAAYEGKCAVEGWRVRRDKSLFWASAVIEAVRDEVGTLAGFVKITRDITERREAQASLERAQEQLAQSQKMEALGQLTGSIAHDFNNLLMIVSGHAQLLRRRLTDPKHLQAIDAVHSAANRGESLTRQLLAFSRRQPLNPVVTDLKERVEAVHEMLVGSLRGNVQLKCDIPADVWPVEVDIAELELALLNIAVNARDAMPGGGSITLSGRNVSLKKSDGVGQLEGDFVALAMTDTGVGIAPDVLPRIFEPFFTTKALGKGTGLGLAQVYGFSHQSGGTVVATSTVGSGTAITIYLPRRQAVPAETVQAPPTQPIVPGQGTILVVEDNAEVADITASLVEQLGYQASRAENAADALNRLQRGDKIDLVFSDVVMPGGMNGIALAQEIGNHYPHIPVVLTSGYSDVVQTAQTRFAILRKPFQLSALEKSIREALERGAARDAGERVVQFARWRGTTGLE
jgi:PAS domain S-box-containing protein